MPSQINRNLCRVQKAAILGERHFLEGYCHVNQWRLLATVAEGGEHGFSYTHLGMLTKVTPKDISKWANLMANMPKPLVEVVKDPDDNRQRTVKMTLYGWEFMFKTFEILDGVKWDGPLECELPKAAAR